MDLLAEHVGLRLEAFARQRAFLGGPGAQPHLEKYLGPIHEAGEVRACVRAGRLDAVVAWCREEASWFGMPVHTIAVDCRRDVDVEAWLTETFEEVLPRLDADLDLIVDASYRAAYRAMLKLGLAVDSIQLIGDVETARARLRDGSLPDGVSLEPMGLGDLDAMLALYAETFASEPEYCWFGAHPRFLEKQRARVEGVLADDRHLELIVRTRDGVRGHASATVNHDNPFWGPTGGMSLCFAPELRGRGVLRPVYRRLLDGMRERGARSFKGGTSQPAVMRLGLEMERDLQAVNLRRGAPFGEAHFAPFLPLR